MDNGNTIKTGVKWKLPAAVSLFLAILCGVAFGADALTARADIPQNIRTAETAPWYEISPDGTELFVFLSSRVKGYDWRYGSDGDLMRQLHEREVRTDDFSISGEYPDASYNETPAADTLWKLFLTPEPGTDGDEKLTFVCVSDMESDSIETRTLTVHIRDGIIESAE